MDVQQLTAALGDLAQSGESWRLLRSAADCAPPHSERLAQGIFERIVRPNRTQISADEFKTVLSLVALPLLPRDRVFEEGFQYLKRELEGYLSSAPWPSDAPRENPAASFYREDGTVVASVAPNPWRRALGVCHPFNFVSSAFLLPPTECLMWCLWAPEAVLCIGYPASYYLARPCYLCLASRARTLSLRESSIQFRNEGHPGFPCCAGPLGIFLPFTGLCSLGCASFNCEADGIATTQTCTDDYNGGCGSLKSMNGSLMLMWGLPHLFAPGCCVATPPETTVIPLEAVTDVRIIDRSCCCVRPEQAELAGISTLTVLGQNNAILVALDAVPRGEARRFADEVMSRRGHIQKPMDRETAAAYERYQRASWLGLYDILRLPSLPVADVEVIPQADVVDEQPDVVDEQPSLTPAPSTVVPTAEVVAK